MVANRSSDPWREILVKHSIEQAERLKESPTPHYDVEKGSLSDDPSDLNHLRHVTSQFDRALSHAIEKLNSDLDYLKGMSRRMVELSEKAYQQTQK